MCHASCSFGGWANIHQKSCCLLFFLVVVCCCLLVLCVRVWLLLVVERPPQKSVLFFCFVLRCFFYGTVQKIQRTTKALRPCRRYEAANRKLSVFLCGIALAAGGAQNFPGRCVNQRCSPGPTSPKNTPGGINQRTRGIPRAPTPGWATPLPSLLNQEELASLLWEVGQKLKFCQSQKIRCTKLSPGSPSRPKLCPLVGSGILYMDHPKDQPLCLVDWTSRVSAIPGTSASENVTFLG